MDTRNIFKAIQARELNGIGNSTRIFDSILNKKFKISHTSSFIEMATSQLTYPQRLGVTKKLEKHTGCVNSIQWNLEGSKIITGSDDCQINIWSGSPHFKHIQTVKTAHVRNIFCAQFQPFNENQIVSCGMDGQVVLTSIDSKPNTSTVLFTMSDMCYKCFFIPDQPSVFLTTNADGCVRLFDLRESVKKRPQILFRLRQGARTISCNSLAFNPMFPNEFVAVGGEVFVRMYDFRLLKQQSDSTTTAKGESTCVKRFVPPNLLEAYQRNPHRYNLTGVDFNSKREIIANYSKENVYLFDGNQSPTSGSGADDLVVGFKQKYEGRQNSKTFLKEVSFFGANAYVVTGGDDGHVYIWEKEHGKLVQRLRGDGHIVNGIAPHPTQNILGVCGIDSSAKVIEVTDKVTFDPLKAATLPPPPQSSFFGGGSDEDDDDDEEMGNSEEDDEERSRMFFRLLGILQQRRGRGGESEQEEEIQEERQENAVNPQKQESQEKLESANQIRKNANESFASGKYQQALDEYDKALHSLNSVSPSLQELNMGGYQDSKVLCFLNKAACFLKIGSRDNEVIEACNSALLIQPANDKALYRRARALTNIGSYQLAKRDILALKRRRPKDETIRALLEEINVKLNSSTTTTTTTDVNTTNDNSKLEK